MREWEYVYEGPSRTLRPIKNGIYYSYSSIWEWTDTTDGLERGIISPGCKDLPHPQIESRPPRTSGSARGFRIALVMGDGRGPSIAQGWLASQASPLPLTTTYNASCAMPGAFQKGDLMNAWIHWFYKNQAKKLAPRPNKERDGEFAPPPKDYRHTRCRRNGVKTILTTKIKESK